MTLDPTHESPADRPQARRPVVPLFWPAPDSDAELAAERLRACSGDRLMTACRLARFYGCSPRSFLEEEPEALARLVDGTIKLMLELAADD